MIWLEVKRIMEEIETILKSKGFKIKGWTYSGMMKEKQNDSEDQKTVETLLNCIKEDENEKVLGLAWHSATDKLKFTLKTNNDMRKKRNT